MVTDDGCSWSGTQTKGGEMKDHNRTETVLEGTVISIDMSSLTVLHLCAQMFCVRQNKFWVLLH